DGARAAPQRRRPRPRRHLLRRRPGRRNPDRGLTGRFKGAWLAPQARTRHRFQSDGALRLSRRDLALRLRRIRRMKTLLALILAALAAAPAALADGPPQYAALGGSGVASP